jgi:hypothetical protein
MYCINYKLYSTRLKLLLASDNSVKLLGLGSTYKMATKRERRLLEVEQIIEAALSIVKRADKLH